MQIIMDNDYLKEKARELMAKEGNIKGETVNFILQYIKQKEGEEGFSQVKEKLGELEVPIDIEKVKSFSLIKESFVALLIITCKELFNWTDEDVFNMGKEEPKNSLIVKLLMKYLVSMEKTFEKAPDFWRKFYDFGYLESVEFNENKKYFILRLHKYDIDPVMCKYLAGFFHTMVSFALREGAVSVEETKCIHKTDEYHEYVIGWGVNNK